MESPFSVDLAMADRIRVENHRQLSKTKLPQGMRYVDDTKTTSIDAFNSLNRHAVARAQKRKETAYYMYSRDQTKLIVRYDCFSRSLGVPKQPQWLHAGNSIILTQQHD